MRFFRSHSRVKLYDAYAILLRATCIMSHAKEALLELTYRCVELYAMVVSGDAFVTRLQFDMEIACKWANSEHVFVSYVKHRCSSISRSSPLVISWFRFLLPAPPLFFQDFLPFLPSVGIFGPV